MNLAMIAAIAASIASPGVHRSASQLAPKNPPKPPPPNYGWQGDGVLPERETRQQRRERMRKAKKEPTDA